MDVTDLVLEESEVVGTLVAGEAASVRMPTGAVLRFASVPPAYDPTDRRSVERYLEQRRERDEIPMGLLFVDKSVPGFHEQNATTGALNEVPFSSLCPGSEALAALQASFR